MIQLPRRSVTRFFIPLIDVMTLLFCIFLLLPVFRESEPDNPDQAQAARDRERRGLKEEVEKLQEEVRLLRKRQAAPLDQRLAIRVLEIDPADGRMFYYAPGQPPRKTYLDSAAQAEKLILRHKREVLDRHKGDELIPELHYLFVFPRVDSAYPTGQQLKDYEKWFARVSHSFDRPGANP
jgi:hypothetical protein